MCSGLSLPPHSRYKVFHYPFVLWRCDCVILWESIEKATASTCNDSCLIHIQMYTHTSFWLTDGKSRKFSFDWNFIAAQGAILLSARKSAFFFFLLLSVQWNAKLSSTDWFARFQRCYRARSRSHGKFSVLCLISSVKLDCKLHLTSGNCFCRSERNVELSRTASHGNTAVHAWATPEIIIVRWIYLYHKKQMNSAGILFR